MRHVNATPDLFTEPAARATDPETSRQAAASMVGPHARHWAEILGVLWRPMTIYTIGKLTGLDHVQVARRMPELETLGLARPTGATEAGPTGRECRLWEKILRP